jgi:hypothetical protein
MRAAKNYRLGMRTGFTTSHKLFLEKGYHGTDREITKPLS